MSIASEITRLQNAKSAIKSSINAKGGNLTTQTLDQYATAIDNLASGGASISGETEIDIIAKTALSSGDTVRITAGNSGFYYENVLGVVDGNWSQCCVFNHNGTRLAIGINVSPYITVYDTTTTPYTKLPNPDVLPPEKVKGCAFNHDGTRLAICGGPSSYVYLYDITTTPYTKINTSIDLSNTDYCTDLAFNNNGTKLVVAHNSTTIYSGRNVSMYDVTTTNIINRSTITIGTYTNVAKCVAFNPDGTRFAVGHTSNIKYLTVCSTNPLNTLGVISSALPGSVYGVAYNHDGTRLAVAHSSSPYITIYDATTTPYTKLANPSTLPTGKVEKVNFNFNSTKLAIAQTELPYAAIYDVVWGTPYAYKTNNIYYNSRLGYVKDNIALNGNGKAYVLFPKIKFDVTLTTVDGVDDYDNTVGDISYSLDNGTNWIIITSLSSNIVINNVSQIKFRTTAYGNPVMATVKRLIPTPETFIYGGEGTSDNLTITEDTTFALWLVID